MRNVIGTVSLLALPQCWAWQSFVTTSRLNVPPPRHARVISGRRQTTNPINSVALQSNLFSSDVLTKVISSDVLTKGVEVGVAAAAVWALVWSMNPDKTVSKASLAVIKDEPVPKASTKDEPELESIALKSKDTVVREKEKEKVFQEALFAAAAELEEEIGSTLAEEVKEPLVVQEKVTTQPAEEETKGEVAELEEEIGQTLTEEVNEPLVVQEKVTTQPAKEKTQDKEISLKEVLRNMPAAPTVKDSKLPSPAAKVVPVMKKVQDDGVVADKQKTDELRQLLQKKASQQTLERMGNSKGPSYLGSPQTVTQKQAISKQSAPFTQKQPAATTMERTKAEKKETKAVKDEAKVNAKSVKEKSQDSLEKVEIKKGKSTTVRAFLKKRTLFVGALVLVLGRRLVMAWMGRGMM